MFSLPRFTHACVTVPSFFPELILNSPQNKGLSVGSQPQRESFVQAQAPTSTPVPTTPSLPQQGLASPCPHAGVCSSHLGTPHGEVKASISSPG